MDDTRVDLSQLEDGSGRSVPSTPLHTSAPGNTLKGQRERVLKPFHVHPLTYTLITLN